MSVLLNAISNDAQANFSRIGHWCILASLLSTASWTLCPII